MLMNPQLQGILTDARDEPKPVSAAPVQETRPTTSSWFKRARLLMTLLPVPLYCGFEAVVGIENANSLWAILLTPMALLWYAFDYVMHRSRVRHVVKEVAHYGLFLTPPVTLFVAGLQPAGDAWPLAKSMLLWGEFTFCGILVLVLWRNRQVSRK